MEHKVCLPEDTIVAGKESPACRCAIHTILGLRKYTKGMDFTV